MNRLLLGVGLAVAAIVVAPSTAGAWQPAGLTAQANNVCENSVISVHNPEGQTATLVAPTTAPFTVGETIPANGDLSRALHGEEDTTVTVTVTYPSDQTPRSASILVHFEECPPVPTTTVEPPSTSPPSTPPPTTGQVPPVVQCLGACQPVTVNPKFTG